MHVSANTVVKLALALAAVLAGSGVGYYYGIFLPDQTRAAQERADNAAKAQVEAERKAARDQKRIEQDRQQAYQDCVSMAELDYRNRWNASCRSQQLRDRAELADCRDDFFRTEAGCAQDHPVRAARDCELPGGAAAAYADDLDRAKAACLQTLHAGQTGEPSQDSQSPDY